MVRTFQQRKPTPIWTQPRVSLNKNILRQPHKGSDSGDLIRLHLYHARPLAAVRASLADVVNGHDFG